MLPACASFFIGVPPPLEVGDAVKVLVSGSTIAQLGEYTVVGVQGEECVVEKEGEKMNLPCDRLVLTIKESRSWFLPLGAWEHHLSWNWWPLSMLPTCVSPRIQKYS